MIEIIENQENRKLENIRNRNIRHLMIFLTINVISKKIKEIKKQG